MNFFTKLSIVFLLTAISVSAYAQTIRARAGFNMASMFLKDDDGRITDGIKSLPGFHLGATTEIELISNLYLETGLMYVKRGAKNDDSEWDNKATVNLHYLDIPLTAKKYFDAGSQKVYGVFGPYIGIGIAGKAKTEYDPDSWYSDPGDYKIEWGSDQSNDDFKRIDAGLIFGGGIEVGKVQVGLSYNLGLANISPYTGNGTKISTGLFSISAFYLLKGE